MSAATTEPSAEPIRDGVPVPDRHTPAGAATAAANFQVAGFRVAAGTLDPATASDVLLTSDADDTARSVLAPPTTTDQLQKERTTFAALSVVVKSYTGSDATVQVWGVSASSTWLAAEQGGTETWGRSTVALRWSGSQWRVHSQEYERGPWPARSDQRLTRSDGDFRFRLEELSQHGWSYVPEP